MEPDSDWELTRDDRAAWQLGDWGYSALRVALLFGSAMIAICMILIPVLTQENTRSVSEGVGFDLMSTGSIRPDESRDPAAHGEKPLQACAARFDEAGKGGC